MLNKGHFTVSSTRKSNHAIFYLCCGCFGYAAFGNDTPGNLLTGFGFFEPFWLIDLANACIILHLVGGYQVLLMLHIKSNFKSNFMHYALCIIFKFRNAWFKTQIAWLNMVCFDKFTICIMLWITIHKWLWIMWCIRELIRFHYDWYELQHSVIQFFSSFLLFFSIFIKEIENLY